MLNSSYWIHEIINSIRLEYFHMSSEAKNFGLEHQQGIVEVNSIMRVRNLRSEPWIKH